MKKNIFKVKTMTLSFFLIGCFSLFVFGQNVNKCNKEDLPKPKFKVAFTSTGGDLGLYIVIKPKYQTNKNLILLGKYLNQKYCEENKITALIFDNKKDASEFTVYGVKKIPDTLRAIYFLDREKNDEKLNRTKVIDNKIVENPLEKNGDDLEL